MIDFILHLDQHLLKFFQGPYGAWTYPLVTGIIFAESAFVIFPFLPGDSLLFTVGFVCNFGMNVWLVSAMMIVAAIVGNDINYRIGRRYGPGLFKRENHRFFNQENLRKTNAFFERYGSRAVVIARFVPFVRSFVPFVAGMAGMNYAKFTRFNIIGAFVWIIVFVAAGKILGSIPFVRQNLHYVVPIIIVLTLLPIWLEYRKHKKEAERERAEIAAGGESVEETLEHVHEVVQD
jgi:membrane-associated protein